MGESHIHKNYMAFYRPLESSLPEEGPLGNLEGLPKHHKSSLFPGLVPGPQSQSGPRRHGSEVDTARLFSVGYSEGRRLELERDFASIIQPGHGLDRLSAYKSMTIVSGLFASSALSILVELDLSDPSVMEAATALLATTVASTNLCCTIVLISQTSKAKRFGSVAPGSTSTDAAFAFLQASLFLHETEASRDMAVQGIELSVPLFMINIACYGLARDFGWLCIAIASIAGLAALLTTWLLWGHFRVVNLVCNVDTGEMGNVRDYMADLPGRNDDIGHARPTSVQPDGSAAMHCVKPL